MGPLKVTLDFSEDCWVEFVIDGRRRTSELRVSGETLELEAEQSVLLTLGNARGVRVEVDGRPFTAAHQFRASGPRPAHRARATGCASGRGWIGRWRANPLIAQVLSGESFELQVLAAQGILPLSAEELIPLQVRLAGSGNELVAQYARTALAQVEPHLAAAFLAGEADAAALEYFAEGHEDPLVVETILRRRDTPRVLLAELAARLPADLQEILLLRQDAIVEAPAILDALETNPRLSIYSRRRILEYREHLLPRDRVAAQVEALGLAAEAELDAGGSARDRARQGAAAARARSTSARVSPRGRSARCRCRRG